MTMKRNAFRDMRLQPGDDLNMCWLDEFGTEEEPELTAYSIADDSEADMGWTCSIEDQDGNESECHDFPTEAALREYLQKWSVTIDETRG
jgi:hypothetical protein